MEGQVDVQVDLDSWSRRLVTQVSLPPAARARAGRGGLAPTARIMPTPPPSFTLLTRANGRSPLLGRHNSKVGIMAHPCHTRGILPRPLLPHQRPRPPHPRHRRHPQRPHRQPLAPHTRHRVTPRLTREWTPPDGAGPSLSIWGIMRAWRSGVGEQLRQVLAW